MLHFQIWEFASPDEEYSGLKMNPDFLSMIDDARDLAKIPFSINSGYRTEVHNKRIKGSKTSSHLIGKACDIHCNNSTDRLIMVTALLGAGFTRIGIGKTFIHCDNDNTKPNVLWLYK